MENSSEQAVSLLPVNEMDELAFLNKKKKKEKIAVIFCCSKRLPRYQCMLFQFQYSIFASCSICASLLRKQILLFINMVVCLSPWQVSSILDQVPKFWYTIYSRYLATLSPALSNDSYISYFSIFSVLQHSVTLFQCKVRGIIQYTKVWELLLQQGYLPSNCTYLSFLRDVCAVSKSINKFINFICSIPTQLSQKSERQESKVQTICQALP